jgi:tetratricopeptide (TPR) repeat protein
MKRAALLSFYIFILSSFQYAQDAEGYASKALEAMQTGDMYKTVKYAEKSASLFETENRLTEDYYAVLFIGGKAYNSLGQFDKALKLMERGVNTIQSEPNTIFGLLVNETGITYRYMGNLTSAISLFRRANRIFSGCGTEAERFVGISRFNIALCEMGFGSYQDAFENIKAAETIILKTGGSDDPVYSMILNLYGLYYYYTGDFDNAGIYYKKSLQGYKKAGSTLTYEYATTLNNLAQLYLQQSRYKEAEEATIDAIGIFKKTVGDRHPDYIISVNNLGLICRYLERFAEAESLYQYSADLNMELFGEKSSQNSVLQSLLFSLQ